MSHLNKPRLIIIISSLILISVFLILIKHRQQSTITDYEDQGGWVYKCSRPIKAKKEAIYGDRQGLVPYDQAEAAKYCNKFGIE